MTQKTRRIVLGALAVVIVLVAGYRCFVPKPPIPLEDALGYANLAINLVEHGAISDQRYRPDVVPGGPPVFTGPPVILELSLAVLADRETRQTFICASLDPKPIENCDVKLTGMLAIHFAETIIFLIVLWFMARKILGSDIAAMLACLAVLGAGQMFEFARMALTETLFIMLVSLYLYAWLSALCMPESRSRWFAAGFLLGLTVLVKSAFSALLLLSPLLLAPYFFRARGGWRGLTVAVLLLGTGYLAGTAPGHLWNFMLYDTTTFANSGYLNASLSHRFGFDLMTFKEWLVGWIYYLPDFGDTMATALFGEEAVVRLGWNEEFGLYAIGRDEIQQAFLAAPETVSPTKRLIGEFLSDPLRFAGITLLLAWRGIFVSKYFGLFGMVGLVIATALSDSKTRSRLLAIALPVFAMAGVHAAISVSVPRYNMALVPVYAIAIAWVVATAINAQWQKYCARSEKCATAPTN